MSDLMLIGALRMPITADSDWLSIHQFISRGRQAADVIEQQAERILEIEEKSEHCEQQASYWAQEARTQAGIVRDIYQLVTGKTGEPGDWNGAKPVRDKLHSMQSEIEILKKQLSKLPGPAWERHTSELLDSQACQLEKLAKAVLAGDDAKAKQLAEEVLA